MYMRGDEFPEELVMRLKRAQKLRYGENPHQNAALYVVDSETHGVAQAKQLQGKELSYNNINDADAALDCLAEFKEPAAVIVKHMNPCGIAVGSDIYDAYTKALECDPLSAFGGIVALNRPLDVAMAEELVKIFLEVVIVPAADDAALKIMSAKPRVRVLVTPIPDAERTDMSIKSIAGGYLVQNRDNTIFDGELQVVSKRPPTESELAAMKFGFTVAKHVKSNAVVFAKDTATVGIGAGQMSRIYSAKIAALKAEEAKLSLQGAVMASDAFMPFSDCIEFAAEQGITAVIQSGGSIKDQDSIDAADKAGMAMVFTGIRHFKH